MRPAAHEAGPVREVRLGPEVMAGEAPQVIVAPEEWQSAEAEGCWALVSCIVSRAFEFSGFTLAPSNWAPGGAQDSAAT